MSRSYLFATESFWSCLAGDEFELHWLFFTFYSIYYTSVFLESKNVISHILASVPPSHTVTCNHSAYRTSTLPLSHTHPHSHKLFLIPGWSEYPTVHCNGTSRWSLIGLDHWTSLGDGCELVVVSQWGGLRYWDSFLSCFCISSSYEEKCLCW